MAHDYVFLESTQSIDFTECGSFSEYAGRVLEGRRRDKAVGLERSLGDPEQYRNGFRWLATLLDDLLIFVLEIEFVHLIAPK